VATTYNPQTNGQVENSNRKLKSILNKTVEKGGKDLVEKVGRSMMGISGGT
jgi:predicted metal-dependent RNase